MQCHDAQREQVAHGADNRRDRARDVILLEPPAAWSKARVSAATDAERTIRHSQMLQVVQQAKLLRDAARDVVVLDVAATQKREQSSIALKDAR